MTDPLQLIWDALAARECKPRGKAYDFRARCPGHRGTNSNSLHVQIGADGRAVVHCFAHGCPVDRICSALGLEVRDLFPAGHHRARRIPVPTVTRRDFKGPAAAVVNVLYALERLGERWDVMLAADCPFCGAQGAWLRADSSGHLVVDCLENCTPEAYAQALLAQLQELPL